MPRTEKGRKTCYPARVNEVISRKIELGGVHPYRAYAALRAKARNRSSFLLTTKHEGVTRTTVGFLAKMEAAFPAMTNMGEALHTTVGELPPKDADGALVDACFRDVIVVSAFDMVMPLFALNAWPSQSFLGREIRELASVTFEHETGAISITATNPNVVERCVRVMSEAPEIAPLPTISAQAPEYFAHAPAETVFLKQLARAEKRLSFGELKDLRLARKLTMQTFDADPFNVFRALAENDEYTYAFFVDLPLSPSFGPFAVAAAGKHTAVVNAADGPAAISKSLTDIARVEQMVGAPAKEALTAVREIEADPRGMRGGVLARLRPGGAIELYRADVAVMLDEEQFQVVGSASVHNGRDAEAHTRAVEDDVRAELIAIARAQALPVSA